MSIMRRLRRLEEIAPEAEPESDDGRPDVWDRLYHELQHGLYEIRCTATQGDGECAWWEIKCLEWPGHWWYWVQLMRRQNPEFPVHFDTEAEAKEHFELSRIMFEAAYAEARPEAI